MEQLARLTISNEQIVTSLLRPFSNFHFLNSHHVFKFAGRTLRRVFSEARRAGAATLAIESICESDETIDESIDLKKRFSTYTHSDLYRITFWSTLWHTKYGEALLFHPESKDLLGYAIVRADYYSDSDQPFVHLFESVFQKYNHFHNFVPCGTEFTIRFREDLCSIFGVMYCQQNSRTKSCAQVALRSLLSTHFNDRPILYSDINRIAKLNDPKKGMNIAQIERVLDYYGVNYRSLAYKDDILNRQDFPYGKLLYAGIENGCGSLLGFELVGYDEDGNSIEDPGRHIIPFFGHTFNQDTWIPRAQRAYFHFGDDTRYIPSDEWLSSYLGHDDNFGSNFCVPRTFLDPLNVRYVVALLPENYKCDPIQAEVMAAQVLYELFKLIPQRHKQRFWFNELSEYIEDQDVVLRTHHISREKYVEHIVTMQDWDGNRSGFPEGVLMKYIPPRPLWMIEMSIPEVFSTNYGKLGEILLLGDVELSVDENASEKEILFNFLSKIIFVRLPGVVLVRIRIKEQGSSSFAPLDCALEGHMPLYGCPSYK